MPLLIADKFEDSLQRLTRDEQKAAKVAVFDLQTHPSSPGLNYEKIKASKDPGFRSVRVTQDIRIIVHELGDVLTVCFVAHHDDAYKWASRRRLAPHPKTGVAQLVELRETVQELPVAPAPAAGPTPEAPIAPAERLFAAVSDEDLLGFGVPEDWLGDVRSVADDAGLEALADYLPAEALEALWEVATGGVPVVVAAVVGEAAAFEHPDAQRRFLLVNTEEELKRALDYPWARWMVFLHPAQRDLVAKQFTGPARVAGSAGTGKTVVALHRAAQAARAQPGARVLLTTFNAALAGALQAKMDLLLFGEPRLRERIEVRTLDDVALAILGGLGSTIRIASLDDITEATSIACADAPPQPFIENFVRSEWLDVVDEWQLTTWNEYRDVQRLGRKKGLREEQRATLWDAFQAIDTDLAAKALTTMPRIYASAADALAERPSSPFDFVIVDEAQDVSVAQLRFIAALTREHPERLFFAGDLGQRIFQTPFSWKALGIDVRGRSRTLRVNYRTSHEIRRVADKLLPPEMSDVDGNSESRRGTVSVFTGAPPQLVVAASNGEEESVVGTWAAALAVDGTEPEEIAVFVRSDQELDRARAAVVAAGLTAEHLDPHAPLSRGAVAIGTMEQAKGLEFRAVAVMACDDEVIPSQARIDEIGDYADLEDVWETERQLLYVACTRARDQLLVTGVAPGSEFLDDLRG